jgi:16S rRNA (guanine1516-N2)-methyltransferase
MKIAIAAATNNLTDRISELAARLNLQVTAIDTREFDLLLIATPQGLELRDQLTKNSKPVFIDFLSGKIAARGAKAGRNQELIAKAVGIKPNYRPLVVDATAGFGGDAFILAKLGCQVVMVERSPIIGALLEDALQRLQQDPQGKQLKISLTITQAKDLLSDFVNIFHTQPDVIYLDPMFPERPKSALNKKEMRLLQQIVGSDLDAVEVFASALTIAKKRVVVKRPKLAPSLGMKKPDQTFSAGKSCRFDIYFTAIF